MPTALFVVAAAVVGLVGLTFAVARHLLEPEENALAPPQRLFRRRVRVYPSSAEEQSQIATDATHILAKQFKRLEELVRVQDERVDAFLRQAAKDNAKRDAELADAMQSFAAMTRRLAVRADRAAAAEPPNERELLLRNRRGIP